MNENGVKSDFPLPPTEGTESASRFFESLVETTSFFNWLIGMANRWDSFWEWFYKLSLDDERDESKKEKLKQELARIQEKNRLKHFEDIIVQLLLVKSVENLLNYLSSLLYEIFTQRPETLRSSDKVSIESVLRHDSIESIIRHIAERKVEGLSYSSFKEVEAFFEKRFHLQIASEEDAQVFSEAVEIRNIAVHNRCVINRRYIARTGTPDSELGKKKRIPPSLVRAVLLTGSESVKALDGRAIEKMNLKKISIELPTLMRQRPSPEAGG